MGHKTTDTNTMAEAGHIYIKDLVWKIIFDLIFMISCSFRLTFVSILNYLRVRNES